MLDKAVLRRRDERSEASADGVVVEHPVVRQQGGAGVQQLLEDIDIGNSGMLDCEKHKLHLTIFQASAELLQDRRCPPRHSSTTMRSMPLMTSSYGPHMPLLQ